MYSTLFYVGFFFVLLILLVLIFLFCFAFVFWNKKDEVEWVGSWLGSGRSRGKGSLTKVYCIDFLGGGLSFFIQQKGKKNTKNWSSSSQMMPGTGCYVFLSIGSCCYGNKWAPFLEAQISIPGSRKVANSSLLLTMRSFCSLGTWSAHETSGSRWHGCSDLGECKCLVTHTVSTAKVTIVWELKTLAASWLVVSATCVTSVHKLFWLSYRPSVNNKTRLFWQPQTPVSVCFLIGNTQIRKG